MTILYADDDVDDQAFVADALNEIDPTISCIMACDGRDAIDKLELCDPLPDFIFLDINMPVMDGKECLSALKQNPRFSAIPIVIYSTSNDPFEISHYYALGANTFLHKPNSFKILLNTLRKFFKDGHRGWSAFIL